MSAFITDLVNSIFTPGPTSALVAATNAAFAGLQLLLAILLIATRSLHFLVMSLLCAALWWSINWFVSELAATKAREDTTEHSVHNGKPHDDRGQSGDDTETEAHQLPESRLRTRPEAEQSVLGGSEALRRRRSVGDGGGDVSGDSEWERVSEAGTKDQ